MTYTAFSGQTLLFRGDATGMLACLHALPDMDGVLVFDDASGRSVDFDLSGSLAEVLARLPAAAPDTPEAPARSGPGRPKLGVVAREVTLLPRHWEWLANQPGGASVALRKLVEAASRAARASDAARQALEACHGFMSHMAGDQPGFEEAARALFAGRFNEVPAHLADWPQDVRTHALGLLERARLAADEAAA